MTDTPTEPTATPDETASEAAINQAAIRSFATLLAEQRYGQASVEASEILASLIEAVTETGKGGSMTLKISVRPAGKGKADRRTLQVFDEITAKLPEAERESSLFYATDAHGLSREDPRQQKFEIKEVPPPAVRDVPDPAEAREVN